MKTEEILRRLEEIEARAEKATPGPWHREYDDLTEEELIEPTGYSGYGKGAANVYADGDFIAACREDTPWLCQVVRQLVARLEKVEAVAEAAKGLIEEVKAPNYGVEREGSSIAFWERLDVLEEALAALEEGSDAS